MPDNLVSIDEFLNARKDFVRSGDILVKGRRGSASTWDPQKRSVQFVMSAEVEDRDRDVVWQDGINIEKFMENPQAFFNHRSYNFPVGQWSDVAKVRGRPKRTEGTLTLLPEGTDEIADQLGKHLAVGSIKACSIGFIPKAVKKRAVPEDKKDADYYWPGYDILECELIECSPCTIPSNPAALAKSAAAGDVIAREIIEEVLDNWVKSESGVIMPRAEWEKQARPEGGRTTVTVTKDADEPEDTPSQEPAGGDDARQPEDHAPVVEKDAVVEPDAPKPSLFQRAMNLLVGKSAAEAELEQILTAKELEEEEAAATLDAQAKALEEEALAVEASVAQRLY